METEYLISYIKFILKDTDLYPNWNWDLDEKTIPKKIRN